MAVVLYTLNALAVSENMLHFRCEELLVVETALLLKPLPGVDVIFANYYLFLILK